MLLGLQTLNGIVFLGSNSNKNCLEMFLLYLTNKQYLNLNTEPNH